MCEINSKNSQFYQGFDIEADFDNMLFKYGENTFGPTVERRMLDSIRASLMDPTCQGPEIVYAIAMDVGKIKDHHHLVERNLLYGSVLYAKGKLGQEPIRSQGHIHAVSTSCGQSTPEVYEIWSGKAVIYMQESAHDQCGRCYAVEGEPGDIIVVPPGWAHSTISADPNQALAFGAWCVRDYGFDYKDVREHKGLAYFPIVVDDALIWKRNPAYSPEPLIIKKPREYFELNIKRGLPIYNQYEESHERFMFVVNPTLVKEIWDEFIP